DYCTDTFKLNGQPVKFATEIEEHHVFMWGSRQNMYHPSGSGNNHTGKRTRPRICALLCNTGTNKTLTEMYMLLMASSMVQEAVFRA
ncbi:hypothetical protein ACJMK2_035864, partial [Sinanodonta woodiana]